MKPTAIVDATLPLPAIDLEAARLAMLLEPIAADFDGLTNAEPVNRCMIVARHMHEAAQGDRAIAEALQKTGLMEALRVEAIARKSGRHVVVPPLPTRGQVATHKERPGV